MGFLITAMVIVFILCLRISVRLRADDEMSLTACIGFIRLKLYPANEKRLKLSDYRIDRFRKKQAKIAHEKAAEIKKLIQKETVEEESDIQHAIEIIKKFLNVSGVFLKFFGKHLRVDVREIVLNVATGDAATTAILFGTAVAIMQNLYVLLVSNRHFHTGYKSCFIVEPDFLSDKSSIRVDVKFSFRMWQLIDIILHTLIEYFQQKNEADVKTVITNI
jgi:hypothetical protein